MIKFESRCIKQTSAVNGTRMDLKINKIYYCGYLQKLDPGFPTFKIKIQDSINTYFLDEEEFFQYFDKKGLRKKKLEILNLAISAKKIKI